MWSIFHPDSKLMRLMVFLTNLVCLNLLWIVSCIPIVTAGAATTAMYSVLFSYLTKQDDAVLKPFLRAFRDNFRQVTPFWLLHLFVGAAPVAGVFYMTLGVPTIVKVIFGLALFFYAAASSYFYPLFARYDATRRKTLLNGFALAFRHLLTSFSLVAINGLPVALLLIAPDRFWEMSMGWTMIGFSLSAWLNAKILLTIFRQYEKKEEEK